MGGSLGSTGKSEAGRKNCREELLSMQAELAELKFPAFRIFVHRGLSFMQGLMG